MNVSHCAVKQPRYFEMNELEMNGTAFVLCESNHTLPLCDLWTGCVCMCWVVVCEVGGLAFECWMSDRREHLSQKHTSGQLIHYSLTRGII